MASALSDVDFNRLQTQQLELRDVNYQLSDKCKWQDKEISSLREQVSSLSKDLQRSILAISKSKKAKECEQLVRENESMQNKLVNQEDEFRLQNETLMKELAQLVAANEILERENDKLKTKSSKSTDESTLNLQDSLRRLQAQNAALQNSLSVSYSEIASLKRAIIDLDGHSNHELPKCDELGVDVTDNSGIVSDRSDVEDKDLSFQLDTERQENKLLLEQLQAFEVRSKLEVDSLKGEVEKLSEKLRKKQESLVELQEDKERLMEELRQRVNEVSLNKDNEMSSLKSQILVVEQKLITDQKEHEEDKERWRKQSEELEVRVFCLEHKVNTAQTSCERELSEQTTRHDELRASLERRIQELTSSLDDLSTQLKASRVAHESASEQLMLMQTDRDSHIQLLHEANKVAEKRKALLDELAIKYQQESSEHHEQIKSLTREHANTVEELNACNDRLQVRCSDHDRDKDLIKQLQTQLNSLESAKSWLDKRLTEAQENLKNVQVEHESLIEKMRKEHELSLATLVLDHQQQIECAQKELLDCQTERDECKNIVAALEQSIKDHVDEKKLHEKKGATVLKDLKRQVQTERKRADKLQEKLQEFLSDSTKGRQSVEDFFRPCDGSERQRSFDSSSVCSWTPSNLSRDNVLAQTPEEDGVYMGLRQENEDLLKRIGEVQQQMWTLEEKVAHLESSNAAMAEDLLVKTAVIEHYVMETKSERFVTSPVNEKLTLKRVVDFVKDKGDENLKDVNRKMQRVLEETLTKNMHLQRDLEALSQELTKLRSKVVTPSTSSAT